MSELKPGDKVYIINYAHTLKDIICTEVTKVENGLLYFKDSLGGEYNESAIGKFYTSREDAANALLQKLEADIENLKSNLVILERQFKRAVKDRQDCMQEIRHENIGLTTRTN